MVFRLTNGSASLATAGTLKGSGVMDVGTGYTIGGAATSGNVLAGNGTNFVSTDIGAWTLLKVSGSDATTTGQTLVDITGLVTPTLSTSTLYEVEVMLWASSSEATNGCKYAVQVDGTGPTLSVSYQINKATDLAPNVGTLVASNTASGGANVVTTPSLIFMKGFVLTGTGTPVIRIQHLKVTSGTSTVKIGSVLKYRKA